MCTAEMGGSGEEEAGGGLLQKVTRTVKNDLKKVQKTAKIATPLVMDDAIF